MSEQLIDIRKTIKKNGFKCTCKKQVILETILNNDRDISAKEIYEVVRPNDIGLSTVYRNLRMLKAMALVAEKEVEGTKYYSFIGKA